MEGFHGGGAGADTPAGGGRYLVMEGTPMHGGRHLATTTSPGGAGGQMVVHTQGQGNAGLPKTLNEMEAELQQLQRENFDLKMAIYHYKELLQKLQGVSGPDEVASLLTERCRELEELNTELEYRCREKDMRTDELEALLAESRAGCEALRDDLRRAGLDVQMLQQEAAAAAARHAQALAGKEGEIRAKEAEGKEAEARWAARCRALEEEVELGRRERASLALAAEQARREAAEARERHARELAALREEMGLKLQEQQAAASSDATTAATALAASRLLLLQQQPPSTIPSTEPSSEYQRAQVEEWRARAGRAEERVRELEATLGAYQTEVRELQQQQRQHQQQLALATAAATAAAAKAPAPATESTSSTGSGTVWKERMELAQRELSAERAALAAREASLRSVERELGATAQERDELRSMLREAEAGQGAEARRLREQLAGERRAKDALLLDMADIRRHGKQQLRDLLEELKGFDRAVDQNFAELLEQQHQQQEGGVAGDAAGAGGGGNPMTTPLKQLLAAEEAAQRRKELGLSPLGGPSPTRALALSLDEGNRSTSQQASGKMLVQQARELVRKWRLKLQALPGLNRQVKEAMARTARGFESRMALMTERLALQQRQLADAEAALQAVKEGRTEAAAARERELEKAKRATQKRYHELITQATAEKNVVEDKCRRLQGEAKEYQELVERQRVEVLALTRTIEEVKAEARKLREKARAAEGRVEQQALDSEEAGKDKRRLQVEMDRLLHQLQYRDDVIAVLQQALASHGLDKQPTVSAQLALLQRRRHLHAMQHHQQQQAAGAGPFDAPAAAAQSLTDLVRAELEQTAASLLNKPHHNSTDSSTIVDPETLAALARHAEALRGFLAEAHALHAAATRAVERFNASKHGGASSQGQLEGEVGALLEANARLSFTVRGVAGDLSRLVRRFLAAASAAQQQQQQEPQPQRFAGSPLRSPATGAGAAAARASPLYHHQQRQQPQPQQPGRSRTVLFGSPSSAPAGAAAAATSSSSSSMMMGSGIATPPRPAAPASPGHHHHNHHRSFPPPQRVEELLQPRGALSGESSLANSTGSGFGLLNPGSGSGNNGQGLWNLVKIQHELQEVANKLSSSYKAGIDQVPPTSPLKPRQQAAGAAAPGLPAGAGGVME